MIIEYYLPEDGDLPPDAASFHSRSDVAYAWVQLIELCEHLYNDGGYEWMPDGVFRICMKMPGQDWREFAVETEFEPTFCHTEYNMKTGRRLAEEALEAAERLAEEAAQE